MIATKAGLLALALTATLAGATLKPSASTADGVSPRLIEGRGGKAPRIGFALHVALQNR